MYEWKIENFNIPSQINGYTKSLKDYGRFSIPTICRRYVNKDR
jgi:hypothetical protein